MKSKVILLSVIALFGMASSLAIVRAEDQLGTMTAWTEDNYAPEMINSGNQTLISAGTIVTRACIGEKNCPVAVNAMFPCGYTEERAGAELCTIHNGDGSTSVLKHLIQHQGTHGGNKCGYSWFLVTCFLP